MFQLAYNLAEGMMPFNKYKVFVKCLCDNKVNLISRKDDHRAVEKLIRYIAKSIGERLALPLCSANAFSVLSDGSEVRKTGMEKELVFVRKVKGGIPKSIDDIFENTKFQKINTNMVSFQLQLMDPLLTSANTEDS